MISMSVLPRAASPQPAGQDGSLPASPPPPTVFTVFGDALVRRRLATAIEASGWQARLFASVAEFLASPPAPGPNCLVLDVTMLALARLDLHSRVGIGGRTMPIILASRSGELVMTASAVHGGSVEVMKTPDGENPVLVAVGHAIEQSRAALEQQAETRRLEARFSSLSTREREVLALVVAGLLNKQVGYELGISEITVKAHRGRVMRKMKAASLPQLVNMAASLESGPWRLCAVAGPELAGGLRSVPATASCADARSGPIDALSTSTDSGAGDRAESGPPRR